MLDPCDSLAFELHSSKGVFALLLGSGISFSANIPTGWDITLSLVKQIAALRGLDAGDDPAAWHQTEFGTQPSYSELIHQLASTRELRQQLIRPYIEPDEDERGRGEKMPTPAHHAIAKLMAQGYVQVVLTTNFDQLLEQALRAAGVNPTIISTSDHVLGARPLVHAGPVIIKLHGDYLDTRILNTETELSEYSEGMNLLLDQVIDEFGLVICGWSGNWDVALAAAIERSKSRRYPTYWAMRGRAGPRAEALIDRRIARVIPIANADTFFDSLAAKVEVIESLRQPHPMSAALAVSMLKQYLPEAKHQIRLHDLISAEVTRLINRFDEPDFDVSHGSDSDIASLVRLYDASLGLGIPMAYAAGMWSNEQQARLWVDSIAALARRGSEGSGNTLFIDIKAYPALILHHAFGLGAIVGRRHKELGMLVSDKAPLGHRFRGLQLGVRLNATLLLSGQQHFKSLPGHENAKYPLSEHIAALLRPVCSADLRDSDAFDRAYAKFEMVLAFSYGESVWGEGQRSYFPPGRYAYMTETSSEILSKWIDGWTVYAEKSELYEMGGLSKPPRFENFQLYLHTPK